MYQPTWLGVPIIQLPTDIVMMQELIWKIRPDVIVECGVAHGGSAILHASICELIGKGCVIGVDIEIRKHNEIAIKSHPLSSRIELIEGSSIDDTVFSRVKKLVGNAETVLVVLDSNHTYQHISKELDMYHKLVTPGSYIVAMDGAEAYVWDVPRAKKEWKDDHALKAIHEFVSGHVDFQIDAHYTRMHVTSSPDGFLRKMTKEEFQEQ